MCDGLRPTQVLTEPVHDVQPSAQMGHTAARRGFVKQLCFVVVAAVTLPYRLAQAKKVGLKLAQVPGIAKVGGFELVTIKGRDLLLVRDTAADVYAINPECTHKKCQVAYKATERGLACKCHKSAFKLDGTVVSGPAPRPLQTFPAQLRGEQVVITLPE